MEAVGQLTEGLARDFSNLLHVIIGNLRFLQEDLGPASQAITELLDDAMVAGGEIVMKTSMFVQNQDY
jgi:hypothetical protein